MNPSLVSLFRRLPLPRALLPVGVLAVSLLFTAAVTLLVAASARAREQARFENIVQATSDRIDRRLDAYIALLRGAGSMLAVEEVSRQEFARYVALLQLHDQYPGVQGIGFTRRFPREQRAALEARMRAEEGLPDFHVWPEVVEDELHSIVYLEPQDERNRAAMGYNMFSESVRREAMSRARDTGLPALSGKVTLKQEISADKQAGFLLYVPIYRGGQVPETVEARREALVGFAYSPFRAGDLLRGIFGTERQPRVAFQLYDGPAVEPSRLLHSSHGPQLPREPMFATTATLTEAGRPWTLAFATLPVFEEAASGGAVLPLALAGVLLSVALFGMTLAQARAYAEERSANQLRVSLAEQARVEEQLREVDQRKNDFLAMLGHELRNPLSPMLTAVQLMERKLQAGQCVDQERAVVERQVHHMARLVDDLLDVSRVSRGKIHLQKRPLELVAAAARALEGVRPFIESSGHTLHVELPAHEVWAEADPVRFEQVLTNLLHNAARYTEPGGRITFTLALEAQWAVVRVADTGVGIPAEALQHLFEPFMQVESSLERAQGGLGLGLTLVKRLVELHGGHVEAMSEGLGKGSAFTVRLPLLPPEQVPVTSVAAQSPSKPANRARRVLVVDDNLDAAEVLAELLSLDEHQVEVAHDGMEAIERARAFAPDVVLLDIGLPGLDGHEVARRLRQLPGGTHLRLVAITGYGQPSDHIRSREAGFDAHLVKPVDIAALRSLLVAPEAPPA